MSRFKIWPNNPNPLFESWLEEWIKEAAAQDSKVQNQLKKALDSLKKYPLTLESAQDCIVLQNFGLKLCGMLEKKFFEHKEKNHTADDGKSNNHTHIQCGLNELCVLHPDKHDYKNHRKKKKANELSINIYAILFVVFHKLRKDNFNEYIEESQLINDDSLRLLGLKPSNIVLSLSTMTSDGLIVKISERSKYKLTDYGLTMVNKFSELVRSKKKLSSFGNSENVKAFLQWVIQNLNENSHSTEKSIPDDLVSNKRVDSSSPILDCLDNMEVEADLETQNLTTLEPNSFDVILFVDNKETSGGKKKMQEEPICKELTRLNIPFEIRHMKIGDFTWIARRKSDNAEFILPFIAERKRMDDLISSIKDGRFHEQKFRMKQSGIENLIYILEHHNIHHNSKISLPTLFQASINSIVQDGFIVKYTENHKDTISYLATMTEILQDMYNNDNVEYPRPKLSLIKFEEFNKAASKSKELTVQDLFIRQLLQWKGITIQKALAIVQQYPTPKLLMTAFRETEPSGEELLSSITYGDRNKVLGSTMSKLLHHFYTSKELK